MSKNQPSREFRSGSIFDFPTVSVNGERIAREEKPVTADTALRLGKFFKTGAAFWMNIQARFDLETAEDVLAPQIKKIASYEAA
jgi:plasmid maintenance system antidote protein VapI